MNTHMAARLTRTALVAVLVLPGTAHACESPRTPWCGARHSTDYNRDTIIRVARARGLSYRQIRYLRRIARRESHYHNLSKNGPYKGLFQLHTHQPKSKWANPAWNTNRTINYIKKRYKTPYRAWLHTRSHGWY